MTMHAADMVIVSAQQLQPIDTIDGFQVRPGFFRDFGATIIPGGVNFTVQSHGAESIELLLFHRGAEEPFAELKFPDWISGNSNTHTGWTVPMTRKRGSASTPPSFSWTLTPGQ